MNTTHNIAALAATLITFGSLAGSANAALFVETVDTGDTIASAIILGSGVTEVQGSLNNDKDLWGFSILGSGRDVQITLGNSPFDDNLILFDSLGRGIAGNDDIGRASASPGIDLPAGISGLDSEIFVFLNPGLYYIAVGQNNISGLNSIGQSFIDNDSGLFSTPTTEVLDALGGSNGTGVYTLRFSSVPEPTSTMFFALATFGFLANRRRLA